MKRMPRWIPRRVLTTLALLAGPGIARALPIVGQPPREPAHRDGWMELWDDWIARRRAASSIRVAPTPAAPAPATPAPSPGPSVIVPAPAAPAPVPPASPSSPPPAVVPASPEPPPDTREVERRSREIAREIDRGNWDRAEAEMTHFAREFPEDGATLVALRERLTNARAREEARARGIRARDAAREADAVAGRADRDDPEAFAERVAGFRERFPEAAGETQRLEELLTRSREAAARREEDARLEQLLRGARALLREGQMEAATDRCRALLQQRPGHEGAQALLQEIEEHRAALARAQEQRTREATGAESAPATAQEARDAAVREARKLCRREAWEEALAVLDPALAESPDDARILDLRDRCRRGMQERDQARERDRLAAEEAARLRRTQEDLSAAREALQAGRLDEAEERLRTLEGTGAPARDMDRLRRDLATERERRAATERSERLDTLYGRAMALWDAGDRAGAAPLLRELASEDLGRGRNRRVARCVEEIAADAAAEPGAEAWTEMLLRAETLASGGQTLEALPLLERILREAPEGPWTSRARELRERIGAGE